MNLHPSGFRIAGRYEVAGRPLMGGMGIVYLCFDHQEQRPLALKTFRPEFLPDRAARERFLQEGETWVRLGKHPHIVRCYQVFQDSPRPEVYLALELIAKEEGRRDASLRSWLTPGRPLSIEQALLIALQIVRGMHHAAETIPGCVHRDLKPENVLVGADRLSNASINRVRVTDFGLVKGLRANQVPIASDLASKLGRLTQVESVMGTPHYMAPEQWAGADVTVQADIYALGCILGEMATGRMLVQGQTLNQLQRAHQDGQTLAAARVAPAILTDLLNRCLAPDPAQRYASWDGVEAAIAAAYYATTGQVPPELQAADALNRAERVAAGWSYNEMGRSYLDMGKAQFALGFFQRVHQAGQDEAEPGLTGAGLGNLGNAYLQLGDTHRAIGCYEQALAVGRESGNRHSEGTAIGNLGNAYLELGDALRAISFYEQALALCIELSDRHGEGAQLGNMANAYMQLGDARRAIGNYERALAISRELGDRRGEGIALGNLGKLYKNLGDARRAIGLCEQALTIARELGDRYGEGTHLVHLGEVHVQLGDVRQAVVLFDQALVISREIGDRHGEGTALDNLGSTYLRLGDVRRAIGYQEQALVIFREIGHRRGEGANLGNLGNAYLRLGDAQQAIRYYEQAATILREIDDIDGSATASFNLALLHAGQGNSVVALPMAREAVQFFNQIGHAEYAQRAQQLVAQLEASIDPTAGPTSADILKWFSLTIEAAVAAAQGNRVAKAQLEQAFPLLTQDGWQIADPIHRIWAGERGASALTTGIDDYSALIVREILKLL